MCRKITLRWAVIVGCGLLLPSGATAAEPPRELLGLPLVFQEDFETQGLERWMLADPQAWRIVEVGEPRLHAANQFRQSEVKTPVRSPFNRSLVKDVYVSDFVLDVQLQSTTKDYAHRDLCLFFGFQDPAHLYYVHFAKRGDDTANQIFIVDGAPRKKISLETTPGTDWDDNWHHARVVRKVETGDIDVYFDDMEKPAMRAVDKSFAWGQVGVGSFDDTGNFDDILVYGTKVEPPAK